MNIRPIQIANFSPKAKPQRNEVNFSVKLSPLNQDTVSFGHRRHHKSHHTEIEPPRLSSKFYLEYYSYPPSKKHHRKIKEDIFQRTKQPEDIAKAERILRKHYITSDIKKSIEEQKISQQRLNKIIKKLAPHPELLAELMLEKDGGGLTLQLPDSSLRLMCKNMQSYDNVVKMLLTKDKNNKSFIDKASTEQIKIINEEFRKFREILETVYLTRGGRNRIPAHFISPEALDSMNELFKNNHNLLKKIYTTTDVYGNTPAHHRFEQGQGVIATTLKNHLDIADIVYRKRNKFGEYFDTAYDRAFRYNGPYKETWDYIFKTF